MLRTLTYILCLLISAHAWAAHDVVVESRKDGKNNDRYQEIEGPWTDSNTPPDRVKSGASGVTPDIGSRKVELADENMPVAATARFYPQLDAPAESYVYVTWCIVANIAPVHFVIHYAAGDIELSLRQNALAMDRPNGNKWILLGKFRFGKGDTQFVDMKLRSGENLRPIDGRRCQLFADAMRFTSSPLIDGMDLRDVDMAAPSATAEAVPSSNPVAVVAGASSTSFIGSTNNSSPEPIKWVPDVNQGYGTGLSSGKRVLVFFHAPDCRVSSQLEINCFTDPGVRSKIDKDFVAVKLNHAQNAQLAGQLRALKSGTLVIVNPSNNTFQALERTETAAALLQLLN